MTASPRQSGNVFFYILVAIALLAALSFAISRGSRTNENIMSTEQAKIAAQEIIDYGNKVAAAVTKLKLRGCSDTQISFQNSLSAANYTNSNAPADKSCHVFESTGGNLSYAVPPKGGYSGYYAETSYVYSFFSNYQVEEVGTSERELLLFLSTMTQQVCQQIATILGQETLTGSENVGAPVTFVGSYSAGGGDNVIGNDTGTLLDGRMSGCIPNTAGLYAYYQVLIAR